MAAVTGVLTPLTIVCRVWEPLANTSEEGADFSARTLGGQ